MTWFKVDDGFHSHPKTLATEPAALGLWVVAGSWCSRNLTDGFVPDYALPRILPNAMKLAKKLVASGLWIRVDDGFRFHDWGDRNPSAEQEKKRKADNARRQQQFRESRNALRNASHNDATDGVTNAAPSRPVPTRNAGGDLRGGRPVTERAAADTTPLHLILGERPAELCTKHRDDDDPPACGGCRKARLAAERWDARAAEQRRVLAAELDKAAADPLMVCEHGTPAGRYIRPATGTSPCPQCRAAAGKETA